MLYLPWKIGSYFLISIVLIELINGELASEKTRVFSYPFSHLRQKRASDTSPLELCCSERDLAGTGFSCCVEAKKATIYFTGTHICCDGSVRRRRGPEWLCCGRQVYNNATHDCCCGERAGPCENGADPDLGNKPAVFNRFTSSCCNLKPQRNMFSLNTVCFPGQNGTQHDITTHILCGGTVMEKKGPRSVCCAGQVHVGGVCCQGNYFYWADPKVYKCCRNNVYDTKRQICCGGKPNTIGNRFGIFTRCCNGTLYHASLKLCCDDVLIESSFGLNSRCCGQEEYDVDLQFCCNGEVVNKSSGNGCCASTIYPTKKYACCNGLLFFKPESFCKPECCGQVVYDAMTQICCSGKPGMRRFGVASRCCNGKSYNSGRFRCCSGNIVPISHKCCGNGKYNPQKEGCCGGRRYKKNTHLCCHGRALRNRFGGFGGCCLTDSHKPVIFNKRKSLCCHDKMIQLKVQPYLPGRETCCGGHVIDTATQHCCDDVTEVARVFGGSTDCCNERPFDNDKRVCCNNSLADIDSHICCEGKLKETHNCHPSRGCKCCLNAVIPEPNAYFCCGGVALKDDIYRNCRFGFFFDEDLPILICEGVRGPDNIRHYECCGHRAYDASTHVCVARRIFRKEDNVTIPVPAPPPIPCLTFGINTGVCCGRVYDVTKSICCSGHIIEIAGRQDVQCCGHLTYLPNKEICCSFPDRGHEVHERMSGSSRCCRTDLGIEVYDKSTQMCCKDGSGIVQLIPGETTGCCAGEAFPVNDHDGHEDKCEKDNRVPHVTNTSVALVCGSKVISHDIGERARCCGDHTVYDPQTHTCCSDVHVIENNDRTKCCGKYFVVDTDKDICCGDRLYPGTLPAPPGVSQQCCGPFLYDDEQDICCTDPVDDFPHVINRSFGPNSICCGASVCSNGTTTA